jgi:hypothetical protein
VQVLQEEWMKATQPLVLQGMNELMENQSTIPPAIGANEDAIPQGQTARAWRYQLCGFRSDAKSGMLGHRNLRDAHKSD